MFTRRALSRSPLLSRFPLPSLPFTYAVSGLRALNRSMYRFGARALAPAVGSIVLAAVLAAPASAHEQGDVLLKIGASQVRPKSNNGSVLNGAVDLDIDNSVRPSLTLTYMATRHLGIELLGAWPFKHNVNASGAVGGQIITSKQLPPTLSLQWHFLPDSTVQPYVGVGLNYTHFFDTKATGALEGAKVKLKDSWGIAGQVGMDVKLNERWFVNADLRYIDISSKVKLNGESIGTAQIDPWVATVAVGYRF